MDRRAALVRKVNAGKNTVNASMLVFLVEESASAKIVWMVSVISTKRKGNNRTVMKLSLRLSFFPVSLASDLFYFTFA